MVKSSKASMPIQENSMASTSEKKKQISRSSPSLGQKWYISFYRPFFLVMQINLLEGSIVLSVNLLEYLYISFTRF